MGNRAVLGTLFLSVLASATDALAQSTRRQQYLGLAEATLRDPITPEELGDAVLSPRGVARIRGLFERSLEGAVRWRGALITPELGGEATLESGRLIFVEYPDPTHPVLREMALLRDRPQAMLAYLEGSERGRFVLKETGGLHALLYQLSRVSPTREQWALLDEVIEGAFATHFKTWSTDPLIQAEMIEKTDWRGRYVGFWHIHPPRWNDDRFREGIEPSLADMTNATELGQFLTIVFQPDGFDFYDLSRLRLGGRADLSKARVLRHRSRDWKRHFRALLAERSVERGRRAPPRPRIAIDGASDQRSRRAGSPNR